MDTISELDNITIKTRRREFEDGFFDFVMAGALLLLALFNWLIFSFTGIRWLVIALQWNRELTIIGLIGLIPLFYLLIMGTRWLIDRIRQNTIWKNSGSVTSLRWQVHWSINLLASLFYIIAVIASVVLMRRGTIESEAVLRVLVSAMGIAMGIVYLGMGVEIKLPRYFAVGIVGLLLSASLMFSHLSFAASWLAFGLIWAAVLTTSGLWGMQKSFASAEAN